ncbi:MAG: glycosyltransferase family 4 protein [Candidatus Falkowbacteria bacterium]
MKVLLVNKFNFIKGGSDRYFLALADLLESKGVTVAKFCMDHPDNLPCKQKPYFVSRVNFNSRSFLVRLKAALRLLYSFEAAYKFDKLVRDFKPDIIHIHNIYHQISPSILPVAKKHGIPVVMHLHDYKLLSPNYKFFSHGHIDDIGLDGRYWRCFSTKCFKDSYLASLLAAIEMYLHHKILKLFEKNIDLYISPSQFMKNKMVEGGIPAAKIKVVNHFIDCARLKPEYALGKYLLYFGRLDSEKGIDLLLKAYADTDNRLKLLIVGSGPEHKNLLTLTKELKLQNRVEFIGPKKGNELIDLIRGAYLVIIPSRWYEVFGLVGLEAAALGKAVLAADIGGIPELVNDQHTGLLYKYDSPNDLATKIEWALDNQAVITEFAYNARHLAETRFRPNEHYAAIITLYRQLIKHN